MLGFLPSKEWWARQGLNLRPHPCEGLFSVTNGDSPPTGCGTEGDSSANERASTDHWLTTPEFPGEDDWEGWVAVWCREDTGTIECVPECLRLIIADHVGVDGRLTEPDVFPSTPYKLARWFQTCSVKGPRPPWAGSGLTPTTVRTLWENGGSLPSPESQPEPEPLAADPMTGMADLYFIQSGEDGPIKIGVSGSVSARIRQLQTAHPYRLRLLHSVPGQALLEIKYHAMFAEHRLEGEWFSPHPDILAEIERLSA